MTAKNKQDELAKMLANPEVKKKLLSLLEQQGNAKAAKSKAAKPTPVELVKYSDKSVAVIGETKPLKDLLKSFGRFNPFLRVNDQVTPGWIVSIKRREELKKALIELGAL